MKYSVIVPIYNAEGTLRRCLDSLALQLNSNIEILLINDGSTDSSCEICKEYLSKNSCFHYFEQENSGVSAARNRGLENAEGEYILFVDSDDYVESSYFNTIDSFVNGEKPDLMVFGANFINRNQNATIYYNENKSYTGIDCVKQITLLAKKQEMYSLWNKVFVKRIIDNNQIRFNQNLNLGEDGCFIFQYTLYIKKITTCTAVLYRVDESNQDSLSRKSREHLCDDLIATAKSMETALLNSSLDKKSLWYYQKRLSRGYYRGAYSCCLEVSRLNCSDSEMTKEISSICSQYKENRIKPVGLEAIIISRPILWDLTCIIRLLLRIKS